jgi:site-specific DNA-cytosine methylase
VRLNGRKGSDIINVLVACEESQEVCKAFRARGHNAFSCDIQECSGGHPEWHIMGDCLFIINGNSSFITADGKWHDLNNRWDLIIAHPPCTDLAVSGARWFPEKQKDFRQQKACVFFMQMALADCDRIAIENPIGIMSSVYRKPDQIIQPWQFGHGETKATCLWLKGLPHLVPTNIVGGREQKVWRMAPGPERAKLRSKTFPGIAKAMAEQWG